MDRLGARAARAACLALVVAMPAAASAQTPGLLRGHLLDTRTLGPVPGAYVSLQGTPRGVLSDSTGYFALPVAISDSYALQVKQLGYRDLVHSVRREAAEKPLVLQLDADPVELEGLEVLVEQFQDRRRGPFGFVDILDQSDLLHAADGAASDLVRRMVPFARPCTRETEDLCVNTQGRLDPLLICVDDRRVAEGTVELEHLDPRGLYMVEIFPRGGQVRVYTRGYIERLVATGAELPPLSFGCGLVGVPGPGTAG
ncbi:MAG: carboxypeptidase-like regulatory domain-containing protein [Longimicrobiales bacterium]|nr:carboxypeptidase-like regulatory domain-containing protein [Longimicrobiales bacterium]